MGLPMAKNLFRKSKAPFQIFDVNTSSMNRFLEEHASSLSSSPSNVNITVAKTPAELAQSCDIIVTMLPASAHVQKVYLGDHGILKGMKKGALIIDSSTIDVKTAKDIAEKISNKDGINVDAPVSGGNFFFFFVLLLTVFYFDIISMEYFSFLH